jgi:hypothetical protein
MRQTSHQPCPRVSRRFESIINLARVYLTTRHMQARRAPWVATIHDAVKETIKAHLTLVHVFHTYASTDTPWVAHALSHCTPVRYGRIASISAKMMLLSLGIPYVPYASVHFKCLFIRTQLTWALIDTGGGYDLGAPNLRSRSISTFPSSILHFPLIVPLGLQFCQLFNHLAKPHSTSIDRKGPIASGFQWLIFYR